ncbi:MAG: hypothetical protein JSS32_05060 [Verrucomicrobia bacterium]|nr:hypothetical protein [Verrucomicrobiota bacterium]
MSHFADPPPSSTLLEYVLGGGFRAAAQAPPNWLKIIDFSGRGILKVASNELARIYGSIR